MIVAKYAASTMRKYKMAGKKKKLPATGLETIGLYATNNWFVHYKRMVYNKQSYGLHRLKIVFKTSLRPSPKEREV